MKRMLIAIAVLGVATLTRAAVGTVEISSFREIISPEVGAKICGYDADQVSVTKHDDLWAIGLMIDNGADGLFKLRERTFPEDCKDADPYPDNLTQPIVNIPEAVKYRKVKAVKRK